MSSAHGPLAGVRVVELAGIGPGPFAAMLLADLGADVIRVDRPGGGLAVAPPEHDLLSRGRPSVVVDLKSDAGVAVVLDLVDKADVLLEGYRPGVAERLGLGPDACLARNPRLVYGRMTGWGQDGPLAHSAGHDINYVSVAGALHPIGRAGGPPQIPLNLVGDFGGGAMYLVVGVLAAVLESRASGRGQVVDAAITDGVAHLSTMITAMVNAGSWNDQRGTNLLDGGAPFYDVYETADQRHMSVGALEPQFFARFAELLGLPAELSQFEVDRWPEMRELIAERFGRRTQAEWVGVFEGTDACVAPVVPLSEAATHPHNVARGTYVEHEGLVQPAPAPRFSRTPAQLTSPPSRAGKHTRQALKAWGIEDVDALIESGAAIQPDEEST